MHSVIGEYAPFIEYLRLCFEYEVQGRKIFSDDFGGHESANVVVGHNVSSDLILARHGAKVKRLCRFGWRNSIF